MNHSPTAPEDSPLVIAVTNLSQQFGRFVALRNLSASFLAGRLYAILGDNGAGKTTLLRTLAGLIKPTRGCVRILGSRDWRSLSRHIGYMAHSSLLYDEMSGMENLRYFARLYSIHDDKRCPEVMAALKLDPGLTLPVGQYSQGMRQRLSLARALIHDPTILLLDEPFSNVDLGSAKEMVKLLLSLRDRGKTILLVTHQASLLERAADEFVWMQAGQIAGRSRDLRLEEVR